MAGIINWDEILKIAYTRQINAENPEGFWSLFAYMYDYMSRMEKNLTLKQVAKMEISKNDTVLDIGCGTGRLSVPIAKKAAKVIAVDASESMIGYAKKYAEEESVTNIKFVKCDWNDPNFMETIGKVDTVVASRTAAMDDIDRLNEIARKRVYVICWGNGPSLREIQLDLFKGIEGNPQFNGERNRNLGYNIFFNRAYDKGYDINIVLADDGFSKTFDTKELAYSELSKLGEVDANQMEKFKINVDKFLEYKDGKFEFYRKTQSFVMWWDK